MLGGVGVAQQELQHLPLAHLGRDGERARVGIDADDVAHQEVAAELDLALLHLEPDEQRVAEQLLVARHRAPSNIARMTATGSLPPSSRTTWPSARVIGIGSPMRPAALRDDGVDSDVAGHGDADGADALQASAGQSAFCPGPLPPDARPPTLRPAG